MKNVAKLFLLEFATSDASSSEVVVGFELLPNLFLSNYSTMPPPFSSSVSLSLWKRHSFRMSFRSWLMLFALELIVIPYQLFSKCYSSVNGLVAKFINF